MEILIEQYSVAWHLSVGKSKLQAQGMKKNPEWPLWLLGIFFIPRNMQYHCLTPMRKNFCTFFTWNQFHEFFPDFTYRAMKNAWRYIYYITVLQYAWHLWQGIFAHFLCETNVSGEQYYCSTPMTRNFCTFFTWNQFHKFFPDFTNQATYENCLTLYLLYNCHAITISTLILYSTKVLTYYITTLNFPV